MPWQSFLTQVFKHSSPQNYYTNAYFAKKCNFIFFLIFIFKKVLAYDTKYSQAVTHPSTNLAQCCLTSVIGRELVLSTWYGRRHWTMENVAYMKCKIWKHGGENMLSQAGRVKASKVAWPSGLRRWFKAPVLSRAWVRIPPLPDIFPHFWIIVGCPFLGFSVP